MSASKKPPALAFRLSRSSAAPPDVDRIVQRSGAFGDAVKRLCDKGGEVTLLTVRDDKETSSYLVSTGQGAKSQIATTLCSVLGAKIDNDQPLDLSNRLPLDLDETPHVSFLVAKPSDMASYSTQSGGDQSEVAGLLARTMQPGSWVAVALRAPTNAEVRRVRRWYRHRRDGLSPTHYSNDAHALVATYVAGAQTVDEVSALLTQVISLTPGFDIEAVVHHEQSTWPRWTALPLGAAASVVAGVALKKYHLGLLVDAGAGVFVALGAYLASLVPAHGAATERSLRASRSDGLLPVPVVRHAPPRPPVNKTQNRPDGSPRHIVRAGDYPLSPGTFWISPAMATGLVSPHTGVVSTVADTGYRSVPVALTEDIGPLVAYAESTSADSTLVGVHLDASELYGGVGALGQPGTGKTTLLHNLFAWSVLERVSPTNRPGRPGRSNTLIAFESKGDGAAVYSAWAGAFNDRLIVVDVADPRAPAIDVVDTALPPKERAARFVDAMKYAFDASAIQGLSTETLVAVFTASMAITDHLPQVVEATRHLSEGEPTFVSIAHLLLGGGATYDDAKQIAANVAAAYRETDEGSPEHAALSSAMRSLNTLFGPDSTASKWSNATSAARNKVDVLMGVPHWWSPARPRGSWRDILVNHLAVVVNSGVAQSGALLSSDVGQTVASMTAYGLKRAIEQHCARWESQGRYISIFADEIAILTATSSEVIEWWRAQGRSYGVRAFLAAQWPDQLPDAVRTAFMSSTSLFWFQQTNPKVISEAVSRLNVNMAEQSPGRWTSADIGSLRKFQAVLHATAGGRLQPPVPVFMAYWTNPEQFAIDQGWDR